MKHYKIPNMVTGVCLSIFIHFSFSISTQAQTLTLDSCLSLARRNNVEIRTSQMEIENALEVKRQVFTKYFPQVNLMGLGYYSAKPFIRFGIQDIESEDMRNLLQGLYETAVATGSDVKDEISLMKHGASGSLIAAQPIYAGGRIVKYRFSEDTIKKLVAEPLASLSKEEIENKIHYLETTITDDNVDEILFRIRNR